MSLLSYHSYTAVPITSTVVPNTIVSFSSTLSVTGSVVINAAEPTSKKSFTPFMSPSFGGK